ncbi:acetate--CoA ligase family protein [Nocardioides marmoriginsengisoli]|uniref:acetate--CoA ligase family protein n=1 Tax=Nocardioides marmoriginsengisoli TaxID=661483 RepID=UPI001C83A7DE|nr:acetate--CoA ligase family protein [Nocardioides marmoriginsengisoli]
MTLDHFFRPRSVAVVGASDTPGRPAVMNWRMLRRWAEAVGADIHPVNPNRETVDGIRCVPDLDALDAPVDVVAVLAPDPEESVLAAGRNGAGFVVVFSAGYAETGPDGAAAQERLAELARKAGVRLLGPNTNLNAFELFRTDLDGPSIALISQSGHQGRPLFLLQENNVAVSHWAPTGNEADLEFADFAHWFAGRPEIGAIAAYVEGFKSGESLAAAARRCTETDTPLVLVKVGRSEVGARAAGSHTGKLGGSDRVAEGFFRQHGIIRVDALDQLGDTATMLARATAPRSDGVAIYSISGGTNAHLADLCADAGLRLAQLSEETVRLLRQWIPDYLEVANPVDCGGHPVGDERGIQILDALAADPDVGVLVCAIAGPFAPLSDLLVADLVALADRVEIPVCVIWGSPVGTEPALRDVLYGSSRVVTFRTSGNCVRALVAWRDWHHHRVRYAGTAQPAHAPARPEAPGPTTRRVLSEHASKALVAAAGIPVPREVLARSADEAVAAAASLGGPVVLKGCAEGLAHKSELGLVRLGIAGAEELRAEAIRMNAVLADGYAGPDTGLLVAAQVDGGVELAIGLVRDPVFGAAVMVAAGGVLIELVDDVAFRVAPFGRDDAAAMVDELRSAVLLHGHRGSAAVDVEALLDAIMAVQALAGDRPDLVELDLNPVLVRAEGVVALDAVATVAEPVARTTPAEARR